MSEAEIRLAVGLFALICTIISLFVAKLPDKIYGVDDDDE